jgi:hypothetical protein
MTTAPAFSPFDRLDWRKAGLAATSVVINMALLTALSLTALGVDEGDRTSIPPPLYLDIEPRPLLPGERPREPVDARRATQAQAAREPQKAEVTSATAGPSAERPTVPAVPGGADQIPASQGRRSGRDGRPDRHRRAG